MKKPKFSVSNVVIRVFFIAYSVIVIYPILWTINTSFKTNQEFYESVWALPSQLLVENYAVAWRLANLGMYFMNSVLIVALAAVVALLLSATAAYVIARYSFFGRGFIHKLFMSGLFVPLALGLIPTFLFFVDLQLYDTRYGLGLIYVTYSLPFSIFVLVGFYKTLPVQLAEAARIDGANDYGIFFRIMLPISKSGLVTVTIFNFLWTWNDYLYAMIFVPTDARRTLPVGLVRLSETLQFRTLWGPLFAGLVIVIVPTLVMYGLFQRQLTSGVTAGGVKM